MRLPGDTAIPQRRSVFVLAGGPGLDATRYAQLAEAVLRDRRSHYDVFLVDQRGTGRSAPATCMVSFDGTSRYPRPSVKRCREAMGTRELLELGTDTAAVDLERVRRALQLERVALYGISYGGRVALEYARRFPDRVAALVLHSPVTFESWPPLSPAATERAFQSARRACASDVRCGSDGRDLAQLLDTVLARARSTPVRVTWRDPGADSVKINVSDRGLAHVIRELLYAPEEHVRIAGVLAAFTRGESTPLRQHVHKLVNDPTHQSIPVFLTVTCREDLPPATRRAIRARLSGAWSEILLADVLAACDEWTMNAERPRDRRVPQGVPILAFTGELDPATPPTLLDGLASPRAWRFEIPNAGHGAVWDCTLPIIGAFLHDPEARPDGIAACGRLRAASSLEPQRLGRIP